MDPACERRLDRLDAHLERVADLIDGVLDVLILTHPDNGALFEVVKRDAKAKLRILQGGLHDPD